MREKNAEECASRVFLLFVVAMVLVCALSTLAQMRGGTVARVTVETETKAGGASPAPTKAKGEYEGKERGEDRSEILRRFAPQNDTTRGFRMTGHAGFRRSETASR